MADGTVRGEFAIDADSALATLTSIRDRGLEADEALDNLGSRMDQTGTSATRMSGKVTSAMTTMSRAVADQTSQAGAQIDELQGKLYELGSSTPKPSIDLQGVVAANAQLDELQARLDKMSRQRVTPMVTMGGSGFGGGGSYGGGTVVNAAGGANRNRAFSSLGGFPGAVPWWAMAAPVAPALVGGATALLGSATSAALGVGTAGIGAAGVLGAGAALSAGGFKGSIANIKAVQASQAAYTKAYQTYGANSKEASAALRQYQTVARANPQASQAAQSVSGFTGAYTNDTRAARGAGDTAISNTLSALRPALPRVGQDETVATTATGKAATNFGGFLAGGAQQNALASLTGAFSADLPAVEKSLQNITTIFENLTVDAEPFFKEADDWVARWTGGLAKASGNQVAVQSRMQGYINSAKDWGHLVGAAYDTVRDIFQAGTPTGNSMVVQLTQTLDKWDQYVNNNPQSVSNFFGTAESDVDKIATGIGNLVHDFTQIVGILNPVITRGLSLIDAISGLGGGNLSLILAALSGARSTLGGGGSRGGILSTAGGYVLGGPAGAVRAATRGRGGSYGGGTVVGAEPSELSTTHYLSPLSGVNRGRTGARVGEQGSLFYTGGNGETVGHRTVAEDDGETIATPEKFRDHMSTLTDPKTGKAFEGGTYAAPVSLNGEAEKAEGSISKLTRSLGGLAKGAATFMLPLIAIESISKGASTPGSVGTKVQATLNAVPGGAPAIGGIAGYVAGRGALAVGAGGLATVGTAGLAAIAATAYQMLANPSEAGGSLASAEPSLKRLGARASKVTTPAQLKTVTAQVKYDFGALVHGGNDSPQDEATASKYLKSVMDVATKNAAASASNQFQSSFSTALGNDKNKKQVTHSIETLTSGVNDTISKLGPKGATAFTKNVAAWVNQMATDSPKLKKPLEGAMQDIVNKVNNLHDNATGSFSDMQTKIYSYNGKIFTGVDKTWSNIRDTLTNRVTTANEKLNSQFGQIQQEAVNALTKMGFSTSQAKSIVTKSVAGGANAANSAYSNTFQPTTPSSNGTPERVRARGGVVGGAGLLDTVRMGDSMVAPGETWIANRHTMNDLSAATRQVFGVTAEQMITGEQRPHSARMRATGGQVQASGSHLSRLIAAANKVSAANFPYSWGGGHEQPAQFQPFDCSGAVSYVTQQAGYNVPTGVSGDMGDWGFPAGPGDATVFYSPVHTFMKIGNYGPKGLGYFGTSGFARPGGGAGWFDEAPSASYLDGFKKIHLTGLGGSGGYVGGGAGQQMKGLKGVGNGFSGIPGALGSAAGNVYAAGLTAGINGVLIKSGMTGGGGGGRGGGQELKDGGISGNIESVVSQLSARENWNGLQKSDWEKVITKESGGNMHAQNPTSTAYGLAQFLDGPSEYAKYGGNSSTVGGQLTAMANYIKGRYGDPAAAWAHEGAYNWYQRGGEVDWAGWHAKGGDFLTNGPTMFGAGEAGRERVTVTPVGGGGGQGNGRTIQVIMQQVTINGPHDAEKLGERVAERILEALDRTSGGNADHELVGA
jgi:hypothetical protein